MKSENVCASGARFAIVFGEADPPSAPKVERVVLNALLHERAEGANIVCHVAD